MMGGEGEWVRLLCVEHKVGGELKRQNRAAPDKMNDAALQHQQVT